MTELPPRDDRDAVVEKNFGPLWRDVRTMPPIDFSGQLGAELWGMTIRGRVVPIYQRRGHESPRPPAAHYNGWTLAVPKRNPKTDRKLHNVVIVAWRDTEPKARR